MDDAKEKRDVAQVPLCTCCNAQPAVAGDYCRECLVLILSHACDSQKDEE